MTGQAWSWSPAPIHPISPVWSTTMPASTRTPQSRPHGAPAYYLARPASWWLTAYYRRPGTDHVIGTGQHDPLAVAAGS
jgi:hypothetical protein